MINTKPNKDNKHLCNDFLRDIYTEQISKQDELELYLHLQEDCNQCDQVLDQSVIPHELSKQESQELLLTIMEKTAEDRKLLKRSSGMHYTEELLQPKQWSNPINSFLQKLTEWFQPRYSALPLALAASLFFPFLIDDSDLKVKQSQSLSTYKNGPQHAYLLGEVHHFAKGASKPQVLPLRSNQEYQVGDAILFGFLITQPGYVTLLREDSNGNFEVLYPFSDRKKFLESGTYRNLQNDGQRMAYFIESDLKGIQKLWLLHSEVPQNFQKHVKFLTQTQKQLFERADHIQVTIK